VVPSAFPEFGPKEDRSKPIGQQNEQEEENATHHLKNKHTKQNKTPEMADSKKTYWVPLESNPAVLTEFALKLGTPEEFGFSDCIGLDEELLSFVPQPCLAVILLYPYSKMKSIRATTNKDKPEVPEGTNSYFMKQLVGNACGTVAIVHSLANNRERIQFKDGFFKSFLETTKNLDPYARGEKFGQEQGLKDVHSEVSQHGQTEAPEADAKVDHHFITFVNVNGKLLEFDGGLEGPVYHGPTTENTFLQSAASVIKKEYLEKMRDELFSVITLGPNVPLE